MADGVVDTTTERETEDAPKSLSEAQTERLGDLLAALVEAEEEAEEARADAADSTTDGTPEHGAEPPPPSASLPEDILHTLETLHPAETARVYQILPEALRAPLLRLAEGRFADDFLAWLDESLVPPAFDAMGEERVAAALRLLESDDVLAVFESLSTPQSNRVLLRMTPKVRGHIQRAMGYPEDTAGRLMQSEVPVAPESWTVGQTIDWMRAYRGELNTDFYDLFVVDRAYRPVGKVPLSRLLRNRRDVPLTDLAERHIHPIAPHEPQEDVAWRFKQYALVSAPVVGDNGRLLGVITADDVVEVIEEELEKDLLRLGGLAGGSVFDAVWASVKVRAPWLVVSFGTILIASGVIHVFSGTIEHYVALAVLMPIVTAIGGNAGTQTLTIAVRGLGLRLLERSLYRRFLRRELTINFILGAGMAVLAGTAAWIWFEEPLLGLVLGVAMVVNLTVAGISGALVPIVLHRIGIDPAVASGVFVSTATDVVGFFVFLGLATLVFL